jgi:phosphoglycerate dehydrogenase-like enzyme
MRTMQEGGWRTRALEGRELRGMRLGLWGYGKIGRRVGELARAFGMKLSVFDPRAQLPPDATRCTDLRALAAQSDVLSLHVPLTRETSGAVNWTVLAKLPPGAFLINAARGALVVERDLVRMLDLGHLGGAALDAWTTEPNVSQALLRHPLVLPTPHLGGSTEEAQRAIADHLVDRLDEAYLLGRERADQPPRRRFTAASTTVGG